MRATIERSSKFKRDMRRGYKTHGVVLDTLLEDILVLARYQDHKLAGEWEGYRECHLKPDLLLIYEKPDDETLSLVRLGSHAELFGE